MPIWQAPLATHREQNCECWLLSTVLAASLASTPDCSAHAALRHLKQGCSLPKVLSQAALAAPDPAQLLHCRKGQFLTTFRRPACHSPLVGKHCLDSVPYFTNEEVVMPIKELIFPRLIANYDRFRTKKQRMETEWKYFGRDSNS